MPPNKRSAGSALLSAKRPRLPVPPKEHDDSQTDGSDISFRALTALSTNTRSNQSTGTRSSQSTTAPIALQEQQEDVPEVEETADTSYSGYDDSPENDYENSEENLDDPKEEPQASTQRSQSTGKRPRTVQPTTARALDNARRRPTGAVAEVIASSGVSVDVGNTTGCESNTETRRRYRESITHFGTHTECISESAHRILENAHRIPESVDFGTQTGSISESIPCISESFSGVSESTPDTLTLFYTAHKPFLDAFEVRRLLTHLPPHRSSPPFEGVGESSMSSTRIPSSPQRSLLLSSRSANVLSMQAQRIKKECSMLIGDHTLLHEPFPPVARVSVLVMSMWAAASRRVGCTVDLDEVVIKQVRSLHSRVRSYLMHEVKGRLADSTIYRLGNLSGPEAMAAQAGYVLKNDCFLSPAQHYESENENVVSKHPRSLTAITRALRAVKDALETTECFESETFNRMSNTWKGRSRQNLEATLEVIKNNLWEKIREKKGITIEVIPEDGFIEDDEALAADLAAFRNARKSPPSALVDPSGSDNGGSQEEVVHAQLRGIEAEEEGEENEEEQEERDHEGAEEEEDV
ncbi:hypothetical protein DFP73DRAFT_601352 [Morchella snyderi]|nr:hypothetical protein DFP73DRAFT_601352 [Morchella snyderi]